MFSWNTIKKDLKEFSEIHPLVNSFGTGDILNPDSADITNFVSPDIDRVYYPLVFTIMDRANFVSNGITMSVSLVFMDKIEELQKVADKPSGGDAIDFQQKQVDDVISDMIQLSSDYMIKYQRTYGQEYSLDVNASIEPFVDRFGDRVAGVRTTMNFTLPLSMSLCDLPSNLNPDTCYYGTSVSSSVSNYLDGEIVYVRVGKPFQITFNPSGVLNDFIWFAVPENYSFNVWQRNSFDVGNFGDLFELYDIQDGYKIWISKWATDVVTPMTII
jgi:hypothetical protein